MSLHTASKYLASKGRKGDTELVHMTKGEVRGLQQLALAHGGSLTINPETGLVEAGWLKTLLPMVAGAALTVATGGTALAAYAPLMAAGLAGGGMYAATGSLKDGLMAGLGAFGGANLAGGLMEAGAGAAADATVAAPEAAPTLTSGALPTPPAGTTFPGGAEFGNVAASETTPSLTQLEALKNIPSDQYANIVQQGTEANMSIPQLNQALAQTNASLAPAVPQGYGSLANLTPEQYADVVARANANTAAGVGNFSGPKDISWNLMKENLQAAGRGLPDIGNVIMNAPGKTALPLAVAGFAGSQSSGVSGFPPNQDTSTGGSTLSSGFQGFVPAQPNPYYQAQYTDYRKKQQSGVGGVGALAEGGIAGLANGGNAMDPIQNPIYPQSQQEHTNFATSSQYPNSMRSAMAADYDTRTDPETGQELPMGLAGGGIIAMASGTPKVLPRSPGMPDGGIYRDTDPDTAAKDAYTAAQIRLGKINKAAGLKAIPMPKATMTQLGGPFDEVDDKAAGGIAHYSLGGYSDGGRMLKGPGDGMSDSIPASIGAKQPARLADSEFVVPADVVSHLGNGSSDAGAKKLYQMMDKVRKARTGKKKQAPAIKADKYLPKV